MNDMGRKVKVGERDTDYLSELSRQHGMFCQGVYQAHINAQACKSNIKTKNTLNDTIFALRSDMTIDKITDKEIIKTNLAASQAAAAKKRKLARTIQTIVEKQNDQKIGVQNSARVMDIEVEETGGFIEANQRSFVYPRLFVVNNDGTAKELLSRTQLEYDMRQKGLQPELSIKQKMSEVFNNQYVENIYFLTKVINMELTQINQQSLNDVELPENARDALKGKLDAPDFDLLIPRQQ